MKDSSVEDAIFSDSGKLFVDRRVTNLTLENLEPLMEYQAELASFAEHKIKPWGKLYKESEETEIYHCKHVRNYCNWFCASYCDFHKTPII